MGDDDVILIETLRQIASADGRPAWYLRDLADNAIAAYESDSQPAPKRSWWRIPVWRFLPWNFGGHKLFALGTWLWVMKKKIFYNWDEEERCYTLKRPF